MINEVDPNNDGHLTFEDFQIILEDKNINESKNSGSSVSIKTISL